MKAFLINLPKHESRRDFVLSQIERCPSIDIEIIEAIDGYALSDHECDRINDRETTIRNINRPLSKAELGCALSHILAYKRIISDNLSHALILEDDVVLPPGLDVDYCYSQANGEDIVMLGVTSNDESLRQGDFRCVRKPRGFKVWGFFAYVVNLHAAKTIVSLLSEQINHPIDSIHELEKNLDLSVGLILPPPITVDYSISSYIAPERAKMRKWQQTT